MRLIFLLTAFLGIGAAPAGAAPTKVTFSPEGVTLVDGKPFFPVGIFVYSLDPSVYQAIHDLSFNTVTSLTEHFKPEHLDAVAAQGLKAICPSGGEWLKVKDHPALLASKGCREQKETRVIPGHRGHLGRPGRQLRCPHRSAQHAPRVQPKFHRQEYSRTWGP